MPNKLWHVLRSVLVVFLTRAAAHQCGSFQHALLPALMRNLSPWLSAGRSIGTDETVAAFQTCSHQQLPILMHKGRVYTLSYPAAGPSRHPWMNVVGELVQIAAADHLLSLEFLLNFDDHPTNSAPTRDIPVWGFNWKSPSVDFATIHYYSAPDGICANHSHIPWKQRNDSVISRYTHYCPPAGTKEINSDGLHPCPRTYFADLARRVGSVAGVKLDIGPTATIGPQTAYESWQQEYLGTDGSPVVTRNHLDLSQYGENKYILVSDGVVGAGKFLGALAFGSTVLFPVTSFYKQWFEPALMPWVHYVPVWANARDDVLSLLTWLQANQEDAERIALKGREFVCEHFTFPGRSCWWQTMAQQYRARLLGYALDDAWFEARKAAFKDMTHITDKVLRCSAGQRQLNSMPACEWQGPTRNHSR